MTSAQLGGYEGLGNLGPRSGIKLKLTMECCVISSKVVVCLMLACLGLIPLKAADLAYLERATDTIIVGAVTSRLEGPDIVSFTISASRVLKGDQSIKTANVEHPWARKGIVLGGGKADVIAARFFGIWFLVRAGIDSWDVLPAAGPDGVMPLLALPAADRLPVSYEALGGTSTLLLDLVAVEFSAGIDAMPEPNIALAIGVLKPVKGSLGRALTGNLAASTNFGSQVVAVALGLSRSESAALTELNRIRPALAGQAAEKYRRPIIQALRDSFRDATSESVKQLGDLLSVGGEPDLRTASIVAISAIHTKEALPYLASLLNSPDLSERMKGVFGISSFANGCPAQTSENVVSMDYLTFKNPSIFRNADTIRNFSFRRGPADEESALVSFWTNWWASNQAAALPQTVRF